MDIIYSITGLIPFGICCLNKQGHLVADEVKSSADQLKLDITGVRICSCTRMLFAQHRQDHLVQQSHVPKFAHGRAMA